VGLCLPRDKFAKELGFAKRTVGNAERGTTSPSLALRRALDEALEKATDAQRDRFLAHGLPAGPAARADSFSPSPRGDDADSVQPLTELASLLLAHVAATSAGTTGPPSDREAHVQKLADYLRAWVAGVNRRGLLRLLPGAVASGYPFVARTAPEAAPGLDVHPVEHFQHMKKVLMDNDAMFGPRGVVLLVQEQIDALQRLRQGCRGADGQELLHVQTQFAELCGWFYQDAGDYLAAAYWSGRALEWAHMCGDRDAIAYILARKSHLAADVGDVAEAADAAEAALNMAPRTVRVVTIATAFTAHGHALKGDGANSERSYATARDLLARREADPASPWARKVDYSYVEGQRARSLTFLGEYGAAVDSFQRAISGLPPGFRRDRGVYLAREAVAHVGHGDVEQASTVGLRALAIGAETRSARIVRELKRVDVALGKFPSSTSVVDFHDAMNTTFSPWELADYRVGRIGE
ncbi:MAG: hypothetical protein ACRDRT_06620, partial [Pseudonocardiaceae bacterium]